MAVTPLIDVSELREKFSIPSDVKEQQLEGPLAAAGRELRSWVSKDAYEDAAKDTAAEDQERRNELDYVEALLAMGFAVVDINMRISPDGILKSDKEEGNVTVQNLTPKEARELQQHLFDKASRIAAPYLAPKETAVPGSLMPTLFAVGSGRRGRV